MFSVRAFAFPVVSRFSCNDKPLTTFMKPALKIGLSFLAAAIVALTLASAWSVRTGWRQVAELTEGLRIAEHVDNAIVEVTGELRRAERAESAEEWARFLERSFLVSK